MHLACIPMYLASVYQCIWQVYSDVFIRWFPLYFARVYSAIPCPFHLYSAILVLLSGFTLICNQLYSSVSGSVRLSQDISISTLCRSCVRETNLFWFTWNLPFYLLQTFLCGKGSGWKGSSSSDSVASHYLRYLLGFHACIFNESRRSIFKYSGW